MSYKRNQRKGRLYTRSQMKQALKRSYPTLFMDDSEKFDKHYKDGIWLSAEDGTTDRLGFELFDYYQPSGGYELGVRTHLNDWANRHGWYFEYLDPGTIMLWKDE